MQHAVNEDIVCRVDINHRSGLGDAPLLDLRRDLRGDFDKIAQAVAKHVHRVNSPHRQRRNALSPVAVPNAARGPFEHTRGEQCHVHGDHFADITFSDEIMEAA